VTEFAACGVEEAVKRHEVEKIRAANMLRRRLLSAQSYSQDIVYTIDSTDMVFVMKISPVFEIALLAKLERSTRAGESVEKGRKCGIGVQGTS
jgi:hypothetical protein